MRKILTSLLFLLFSGNILAYEFPVVITEYFDEIKIDAYIKKSDINTKLQWTPFKSPPPLSINDALQAVNNYIVSNNESTNIILIGIELKQIPRYENVWHYLVKVKSTLGDISRPHFFVVLMDGKVISAIKEPVSIK